jgi:hypothetical protein
MTWRLDWKKAQRSRHAFLALQCGLAECTAHIGTKFLKLRPYKTTVVHSPLPPDCDQEYDTAGDFRNRYSKDILIQNLCLILARRGTP